MSENVKYENKNAEGKDLTAEIRNLVVEFRTDYGVVQALNGLDLEIGRGKTLGLVGETGAGKTTTGLSLLRLIPDPPGVIVEGSIKLDGEDILAKSEKEMQEIRGKKVAMIFQDPMASLNERAKVDYIVSEGLYNLGGRVSEEERRKKVAQALSDVGLLPEFASRFPHEFSGGQRQRIGIARALIMEPELPGLWR